MIVVSAKEAQSMNDIIESENERAEINAKLKKDFEKSFDDASVAMDSILEKYMLSDFAAFYAHLLVYMGKQKALAVLEKMPEGVKELVSQEYSKMKDKKNTDPDVISDVCSVFKRIGFYGEAMLQCFSGIENNNIAEVIGEDFFNKNPVLEMNIENSWFYFDDIVLLDDRAIQKILREVDQLDLAVALKGSDAEIQDKIFRNMSKRAEEMLRDDMEFMGPVRLADVQYQQNKIVGIVKSLIRNKEIVVSLSSDDEVV